MDIGTGALLELPCRGGCSKESGQESEESGAWELHFQSGTSDSADSKYVIGLSSLEVASPAKQNDRRSSYISEADEREI